ncbi:MAG: OmpA family protein [Cyclobacteriaceae bacterium]|nr:OmpA family protein [Cyclobacteriaceae bacterium]
MRIFFGILFSIVMVGCVTQKKYNELLAEKVQLEGELVSNKDSLSQAKFDMEELDDKLLALRNDTAHIGAELRENTQKLKELQSEYDKLEVYYNNLLNNSGKLNKDLAEQQSKLQETREELEGVRLRNEELAADLAEREKKVAELEDILARKDEAVNALRKRITDALLNFKENDLTVQVKNGKVYVSLAEQLLFNSGSVIVDPKGQNALQQLAVAIKDQKDLSIMVEGHSDNVPISRVSQYMNDNWDLSVMRATSIVRILIKAGLAPDQVTAAGKGEFSPVDTNDTAEGRNKNRRTEIIITPNLDELFKILGTN